MDFVKKAMSFFTAFAFLAVMAFAPLAAADDSNDDQSSVCGSLGGDTLKEKYNNAKDRYNLHVDIYKDKKQEWLTAKDLWRKGKNVKNATPELVEKGKAYLISALDKSINYIGVLEVKADCLNTTSDEIASINSQLAAAKSDLEALKTEVNALSPTSSKEEFNAVAIKVKDEIFSLGPLVKRMAGLYLSERINKVLAKGDELAAKAQENIDVLKAGGINTANLEAKLANYNAHLATAKQKYEAAKAKFNAISNLAEADALFREGNQFIKDANEYVKKAYQVAKDMRKDFGRQKLAGTGAVSATGNGLIKFSISNATGGTIIASTDSNGALFVTTGTSVATSGQGTIEDEGNGQTKYKGFGTATITVPVGSTAEGKISGNDLNVYASGSGYIVLNGNGSYNTSTGKNATWPANVVVSQQ